jgi:hypothetical protein
MRQIGDKFLLPKLGYRNEVGTVVSLNPCNGEKRCEECPGHHFLYNSEQPVSGYFCEKYIVWID